MYKALDLLLEMQTTVYLLNHRFQTSDHWGVKRFDWASAGGLGAGSLLLLTSSGVPIGQNKR